MAVRAGPRLPRRAGNRFVLYLAANVAGFRWMPGAVLAPESAQLARCYRYK